jgi:uncharacterized cupin superfamily protein
MPAIRGSEVEVDTDGPPEMGRFESRLYSDAGGLAQFGLMVETLHPGAVSSNPHWHEEEDEIAYVLTGEVTLVEDGAETVLYPGDAAAWKAGSGVAHHLANRSEGPASYVIVGTRAADDVVHYPGRDELYTKRGGVGARTRRDGSPLGAQGGQE